MRREIKNINLWICTRERGLPTEASKRNTIFLRYHMTLFLLVSFYLISFRHASWPFLMHELASITFRNRNWKRIFPTTSGWA